MFWKWLLTVITRQPAELGTPSFGIDRSVAVALAILIGLAIAKLIYGVATR
jgi:hypothetical protein